MGRNQRSEVALVHDGDGYFGVGAIRRTSRFLRVTSRWSAVVSSMNTPRRGRKKSERNPDTGEPLPSQANGNSDRLILPTFA